MDLNLPIETNNDEQKLEITNIDALTKYLRELKKQNTGIYKSLINAQFHVLKYGSDPQVLISSFDLFFKELPSLQHCEKNEEQIIRKYTNMLIHSFISFTNTKLEYSISKNKFLVQDLLKESNHQLILSCINVIRLCDLSMVGTNQQTSSQERFILEYRTTSLAATPIISVNKINIHIDKIVNEFTKSTIIKGGKWDRSVDNSPIPHHIYKVEQESLIFNIKSVIKKLDTYQDTIGKFNIIFSFIDNYTRKLVKIKTSLHENTIKNRKKTIKPLLIVLLSLFFVYIIFGQNIDEILVSNLEILTKYEIVEDSNIFYYSCFLFLIILISLYSFILLPKIKLMFKLKRIRKEYKRLSQNFIEI